MKHSTPLTLAAARSHFRAEWLPRIPSNDRPAVRVAWSQFLDALHRERRISDKQFNTWDIPANFGKPRKAARKNPSACGCRSNPSKARKPKRTTKKATRAPSKARRTTPARKRR
jgi:hypothetical protein